MTVTYRVTRGELIRGGGALGRRSWAARIVGLLAIGLGLQPLLTMPGGITLMGVLLVLPLLVLGILFLSGAFYSAIVWYYARKRPELVEGQQTMTADNNGMRHRGQFGEGAIRWNAFRKASETRELFFLDSGTGSIQLIAKSGFTPEQLETFRRLLERNGLMQRR